jgi:hypothetical protein
MDRTISEAEVESARELHRAMEAQRMAESRALARDIDAMRRAAKPDIIIPALKALLERCDEYGDCLCWKGSFHNGSPQVWVGRKVVQLRPLVYDAWNGEPVPQGKRAFAGCREPRCIKPSHVIALTPQEIGAIAASEGKFSTPKRRAAVAAGRRRSTACKLTVEIAREIRTSTESGPVLAARYGIHRSLAARIKSGGAWAEGACGASVFNLQR